MGFPVFRFYHQNTPQHETLLWIYLVDIVGVLPDKIKKKTHNNKLTKENTQQKIIKPP